MRLLLNFPMGPEAAKVGFHVKGAVLRTLALRFCGHPPCLSFPGRLSLSERKAPGGFFRGLDIRLSRQFVTSLHDGNNFLYSSLNSLIFLARVSSSFKACAPISSSLLLHSDNWFSLVESDATHFALKSSSLG